MLSRCLYIRCWVDNKAFVQLPCCKFRAHVNLKLIKANKCLNDLRTLRKEQYSEAEIDHLFKFLVLPNFIYGLPAWSFWTWYQYQGLFFRNWPIRVKWAPFFNFRGPFFKTGVPQKVFQLIGTEYSLRKRRFIEIIIYRLASTEHEVKMTLMLKHKWKASLLHIYSALSSNIRVNNFVSSRPQVLRKKVSVTHNSDCSFSTLLFFFVCHTWHSGGGGYSIYPWMGGCGPAPHTLTLFKTKIADFTTLFKTFNPKPYPV